jgi:hypothetical protein
MNLTDGTSQKRLLRMRLAERVIFLAIWLPSTVLAAPPLLRCEINESGESYLAEFFPTSDPYTVVAKDIGGRFRFKVVMMQKEQLIEYIKIYTYYQGQGPAVLLHVAKYMPPFRQDQTSFAGLTGVNFLYSPGLERELQYGCTLSEIPP